METAAESEVVMENSALYCHLKSVGFLEVEEKPSQSDPQTSDKQSKQDCLKKFKEICTTLVHWKESKYGNLKKKVATSVYNDISSCKSLEEEDRLFLEQYDATLSGEGLAKSQVEDAVDSNTDYMRLWTVMAAVTAYSLGRLFINPEFLQPSFWLIDIMVLLGSILIIFPSCVKALNWNKERRKLFQIAHTVSCLTTQLDKLADAIKKSIRLIQEKELIAKGYTVAIPNSAIGYLEQNQLKQSQRQCPQLRKTLFYTARECLLEFKELTLNLLYRSQSCNRDSSANYVAQIPLDDYGPCLTEDQEEKVKDLTDGYSIAALKAISQLCNVHSSELLRKICLLCTAEKTDTSYDDVSEVVMEWITETIEAVTTRCLHLQQKYDYHKGFKGLKSSKMNKPNQNGDSSLYKPLYMAVHSLGLHLESALQRIGEMEEHLEMKITKNQDESHDSNLANNVAMGMKKINGELEASKACWEEGCSRMEKIFHPHTHETKPKEDCKESLKSSADTTTVKHVDVSTEPIIEDQVFEAYTDPEQLDSRDCSWDSPLTAEEKAKKKDEKQEAVRLLQELKSVISLRAEDRIKREEMAIQKSQTNPRENVNETETNRKERLHTDNGNIQNDTGLLTLTECQSTNESRGNSTGAFLTERLSRLASACGSDNNYRHERDISGLASMAQEAANSRNFQMHEDFFGESDTSSEYSDTEK